MKKILVFIVLVLSMLATDVKATQVEKLIFDLSTPTEKSNYALVATFRASLFEHNGLGVFGINVRPAYLLDSGYVNLKYGIFVRPIKYVEVYADRIQHIDFDAGMNKGPSIIGLRVILFDR